MLGTQAVLICLAQPWLVPAIQCGNKKPPQDLSPKPIQKRFHIPISIIDPIQYPFPEFVGLFRTVSKPISKIPRRI